MCFERHSSNCFSIVLGKGNAPLVTSLPSSRYMTHKYTTDGLTLLVGLKTTFSAIAVVDNCKLYDLLFV